LSQLNRKIVPHARLATVKLLIVTLFLAEDKSLQEITGDRSQWREGVGGYISSGHSFKSSQYSWV